MNNMNPYLGTATAASAAAPLSPFFLPHTAGVPFGFNGLCLQSAPTLQVDNFSPDETIEIFGRVNDILKRPDKYNKTFSEGCDNEGSSSNSSMIIFRIFNQGDNRNYLCKCFYYCPLEKNDSIFCLAQKDVKSTGAPYGSKVVPGERIVIIKTQPMVELPSDDDSIIEAIVKFFSTTKKGRAYSFGIARASKLIDHIRAHAKKNTELNRELVYEETSGQVDLSSMEEKFGSSSTHMFLNRMATSFMKDGCVDKFFIEYPPYLEIIDQKYFGRLLKWWDLSRLRRTLHLFGLNDSEINASHMEYREIIYLCKTNPFRILPVPIDKCIRMIENQLKEVNPTDVRCGQIVRRLAGYTSGKQWCCVPLNNAIAEFSDFESFLDTLINEYRLFYEYDSLYLPLNRIVEHSIAEKLVDLYREPMNVIELSVKGRALRKINGKGKNFLVARRPQGSEQVDEDFMESPADNMTLPYKNINSELTEEQRYAVMGLLSNNVAILNARAGCGKTTIIAELVQNLNRLDVPYIICGYTGKSVARVSKEKGINSAFCSTFHRAIGKARQFYNHFSNEEKNEVGNEGKDKFRYLICEESSMISSLLFWKFIKTFKHKYRIVFVGDQNQLPPMEFGSIFREIIRSQVFPVYSLTQNHRILLDKHCADGILLNANLIIDNPPGWRFQIRDNFSFIPGDAYTVLNIVANANCQGINVKDISVICPYSNDQNVDLLNIKMQEIFCGDKKFIQDSRGSKWFIGDKLMFTKNNYDKDVFNGDDCRVVEINEMKRSIKVELFRDQRLVEVPLEPAVKTYEIDTDYFAEDPTDTKEDKEPFCVKFLVLAYIISCHKHQGSEASYIIIYMPDRPNAGSFINKHLLYTSITRARKQLWIVGDINAFIKGAYTDEPIRHENLHKRIQNLYFKK